MARIREFNGLRPDKNKVHKIAELPYDVVSSEEARQIAGTNEMSFFHISKPEVDLPENIPVYDDRVYEMGKNNLERFIKQGLLKPDVSRALYLYTLIMDGRSQTGLVGCLYNEDYINNKIKKHELTREDKERDRMRHLDSLSAQTGLVFIFYKEDGEVKSLLKQALLNEPEYDFTTEDGIRHIFRIIENQELINSLKSAFLPLDFYIADGHHRAASAVKVGQERNKNDFSDKISIEKEYNWFLAVIFPHDELKIMPYNRVIKDLNGLSSDDFIKKISGKFKVEKCQYSVPRHRHEICMFLDEQWYNLDPIFEIGNDPIGSLDVSILQEQILKPILGIIDPRRDNRIDFIGGKNSTLKLEKLVSSGKYRTAFSLYPTSIEELISVADTGALMPPKSTWFEPKLRSGMILHLI